MKKIIVILIATIFIVTASVIAFAAWQKAQWRPQRIDDLGVHFLLHKSLTASQLSDEDKTNKIVFRINHETEERPFLMTFRYEDGLRLPTSLTHQDLIPMLLGNIDKAYPARFPGYQSLSTRQFEQTGHKAAEIIFTYQGPTGEKVKQRFLMLDIDGNRVLYVAAQAKEADFAAVNKKVFNRLFESLSF
jgi:hypothetical protein